MYRWVRTRYLLPYWSLRGFFSKNNSNILIIDIIIIIKKGTRNCDCVEGVRLPSAMLRKRCYFLGGCGASSTRLQQFTIHLLIHRVQSIHFIHAHLPRRAPPRCMRVAQQWMWMRMRMSHIILENLLTRNFC